MERYIKPFYGSMMTGFVIKFLGTIMDLGIPYILAHIIDRIIPQKSISLVVLWAGFMLLCSVLCAVFNIVANRKASRIGSDIAEILRHDLFSKIMNLSSHQIDEMTRPSLISRMTTDTYNIHQMVTRIQRIGVRAPILIFGGVLITMTLDPVLAGILLLAMPVLLVIMILVTRRSLPLYTKIQEANDRFVRLVREDISGIRVIKALSRTDYERDRFEVINQEVVANERSAGYLMAILNPSMTIILNLSLIGVILAGAFRVNSGVSEVGKLLAFMTYFTIILNSLMIISRIFAMVSKAIASGNRIGAILELGDEMTLLDLPQELQAELGLHAEAGNEMPAKIEFDKVTFSYHKEIANVKDISFCLKKGQTLGIIGETGSGKTTLASLLLRQYDVDEGCIRIDGRDIRTIPKSELRKKFGVVFQNDTLFEDTIVENVTLGRDISPEQVEEALLYARAREFVKEKRNAGGEQLNIKGANLSGGQKQRVLIARALAARPEILILDDSSSALDYKTDAALRREIREHFADTTLVIIAQRISSISHADLILVLEDGVISGSGSHEELLESCALYREISNSQMGEGVMA